MTHGSTDITLASASSEPQMKPHSPLDSWKSQVSACKDPFLSVPLVPPHYSFLGVIDRFWDQSTSEGDSEGPASGPIQDGS